MNENEYDLNDHTRKMNNITGTRVVQSGRSYYMRYGPYRRGVFLFLYFFHIYIIPVTGKK